jgi:hypothetical protein
MKCNMYNKLTRKVKNLERIGVYRACVWIIHVEIFKILLYFSGTF